MSVAFITTSLAALTIVAQIFIVIVFAQLLFSKGKERLPDPARFLGRNAIVLGFLATFGALVMSFYYSNIVGYEPCLLCWYQRIFLWPQAIVFGLALLKGKDKSVVDYMLALSLVGAVIAIYHIYIELGGADIVGCGAYEGAVSCDRQYIHEFGYITLPVMSLTTYAGIIITMLAAKRVR